jgi:hypothetical protein
MVVVLIDPLFIATCGMNCAICIGHLRAKNKCAGCNGDDKNKPKHCVLCRIKNCDQLNQAASHFCYVCDKFPCTRLKQLDKRYRSNYGMSMIENLLAIQEIGLDVFVRQEQDRWRCSHCGALLSVHRNACLNCGAEI